MSIFYFNCIWDEFPKAWISETRINGFEYGNVKWRNQNITISINSNIEFKINKTKNNYPLDLYALLKSNLQKQIRRCKIGAITSALKLWELCQFELLRRLAVIAPEDVILSKETSVIVWLMVACSKGVMFDSDQLQWVLGYVNWLIEQIDYIKITEKLNKNLTPITLLESNHQDKEYLTGILFRCAYGGLKCDPPMISQCVDWYLQTNNCLVESKIKRFILSVPPLKINPASIDFHIWSNLIIQLHYLHLQYTTDFIKQTVWECNSSFNKRKKVKILKEYKNCWKDIKNNFTILTKNYLNTILKKHECFLKKTL